MVIYRASNRNKKSFLLFYLISLWFLIPWLVMSTYSGELTDYYFSLPRDIVIAICAYLTVFMLRQKRIIFKIAPLFFWIIYALLSLQTFFNGWGGNLTANKKYVKQVISDVAMGASRQVNGAADVRRVVIFRRTNDIE